MTGDPMLDLFWALAGLTGVLLVVAVVLLLVMVRRDRREVDW